MVETQVCPPSLPQVSTDPVSLGAGEPAVTGVIDDEYTVVWGGVSLDAGVSLEAGVADDCIDPVAYTTAAVLSVSKGEGI